MHNRLRRPETWLLLLAVILTTLTATVFFSKPLKQREQQAGSFLDLRVADKNGRLRIDWDAANPLIVSSQGATLEVDDGGAFNRYPVDAGILKSGGLDYVRRSDDVLLTLTLLNNGRPGVQTTVRRISTIDLPLVTEQKPAQRRSSRGRQSSRARRR